MVWTINGIKLKPFFSCLAPIPARPPDKPMAGWKGGGKEKNLKTSEGDLGATKCNMLHTQAYRDYIFFYFCAQIAKHTLTRAFETKCLYNNEQNDRKNNIYNDQAHGR